MYEVVSIRFIDEGDKNQYGLLPLIENAMIYVEEILREPGRKLAQDPDCNAQIIANINGNFLSARYENIDEALEGYACSREMCLEAALDTINYVVDFLEVNGIDISANKQSANSPSQINISILYAGDHLKHFGQHFVILTEDLFEKKVYLMSPSNVFNIDGTLPYVNGTQFIRTKDVIVSDNREGALMGLNAIEVEDGGEVNWKEIAFTEELRHKPPTSVFMEIYQLILKN